MTNPQERVGRRWPELLPVVAAAVSAVALGVLLLSAAARHTDLLLADFREWRPVALPPSLAGDLFARLQTAPRAQRPFRVSLRLPGRPRAGAYLGVEKLFAVDPEAVYCFSVLTWSERRRGAASGGGHRAVVWVDGEPRAAVPALTGGQRLAVDGIRSPRGEVRVRVGLQAEAVPGGRPASPVTHFEYAHFARCPGRETSRPQDAPPR